MENRFQREQVDRHVAPAADVAAEYLDDAIGEVLPGRRLYVLAEMAKMSLMSPMSSTSSLSFETLWEQMGDIIHDRHADVVPPLPDTLRDDFVELTEVDEPAAPRFENAPPRDERAYAVLTMMTSYGLSCHCEIGDVQVHEAPVEAEGATLVQVMQDGAGVVITIGG